MRNNRPRPPAHWKVERLGSVLPLSYGKALAAKERSGTGEFPVYGSSGELGTHDKALTSGPAIIVGRKGNVGATYLSNRPCWAIDTAYFSEGSEATDLRFFVYLLRSLNLAKLDRSTAVPGLSRDDFNVQQVPVPPLPEQARTVAVLDSYFSRLDDVEAGLERVQRNLKRYRASVLQAAVTGRLVPTEAELARAEGREYEPASVLLKRILSERRVRSQSDEKRGSYKEPEPVSPRDLVALPEGWVWTTTDAVGDVLLGRQRAPQYLTGRYSRPYLRVANVKDDRIDFSDLEEMDFDAEHFEKYQLRAGDILVSEGQSLELLGQSAIYRGGIEGLCFQKTLHRFRAATPGPTPEFAQIVFRSHVMNGVFSKLGSITTNIAHLTLVKFKASPFPLPPAAEQARIVEEVNRLLSIASEAEELFRLQLARTRRLRQAILSLAFAGELVA